MTPSICLFVSVSKTLTGSEVKYTVVMFFQIKTLFCENTQNVLSNRANFLEKK